jgi:hypothetical protein
VPGAEVEIIGAVNCGVGRNTAKWRVVELFSDERTPWEAQIGWSGGMAGKRKAYVTVVQNTRVCIHAASLDVKGKALTTTPCTAWAAIADGVVHTENEYSIRGEHISPAAGGGASAGPTTIPVPPFARFVRLELATESEYALSAISLTDGWGLSRNQTRGDRQPNPGLPIGDSQTVTITTTNPVKWRVTFLLNL